MSPSDLMRAVEDPESLTAHRAGPCVPYTVRPARGCFFARTEYKRPSPSKRGAPNLNFGEAHAYLYDEFRLHR